MNLFALSLLVGFSQDPQPPPVPPPGKLETILWLHGGPIRDADFFAAVTELGFTAVSVSTGEDPSVPAANGLGFYLDQAVGKGVLELRDEQW